jgi:hypothetical protein
MDEQPTLPISLCDGLSTSFHNGLPMAIQLDNGANPTTAESLEEFILQHIHNQ